MKEEYRMKIFTFKKLGRTLALAAVLSVGSVCWLGCGGDDNSSGGGGTNNPSGGGGGGGSRDGNVVGDWWLGYDNSVPHNNNYIDITSYKSSGELLETKFNKINDTDTVWLEHMGICGAIYTCTWRTDGSKLYQNIGGLGEIFYYYNVSGDTLTGSMVDSSLTRGAVRFIRTDLAAFRSSLGL
jgi:hypothetical protein